MNEAFRPAAGPGMRMGRGPGMEPPREGEPLPPPGRERGQPGMQPPGQGRTPSFDLDPLVGMSDARKPLRSRLLAVPALRARYLEKVRAIAEKSLDWQWLGPIVGRYRQLAREAIEADTRKLSSYEAFLSATADQPTAGAVEGADEGPRRPPAASLRVFADRRRAYLLGHAEVKAAGSGKDAK
jgi:hypothetical protein